MTLFNHQIHTLVRWTARRTFALLILLGGGLGGIAVCAQNTWDGSIGGWNEAGQWSHGVPAPGDHVVISAGTVTLTNATTALNTLTIDGSGRLIFSGADAVVTADDVVLTGSGVRVEHTVNTATADVDGVWPIDGRVHFICTNFFLDAGTIIEANARGWGSPAANLAGYGPGAGGSASAGRAGAGYGGFGGNMNIAGGHPYGSPAAPDQPGSGGGGWSTTAAGGGGGGLVIIESHGGTVTVNGTIRADGAQGGSNAGGGSGGAVAISCDVFAGANGTITANGGNTSGGGRGGGGRIAIDYDIGAQNALPVPTVTFAARPGTGGNYPADPGTLYFPDNAFLTETVKHSGQWRVPGFTQWAPDSLTIDNGWIRFPYLQTLTVTNTVLINGSNGGLELGGNNFYTHADNQYREGTYLNFVVYTDDMDAPMELRVGGDLTVTNGAFLRLYSPPTNGLAEAYGALVAATNDFTIAASSYFYPVSDMTNGASVHVQADNVAILPGGVINANGAGFGPGNRNISSDPGYGPGGGRGARGGAGYGGFGGNYANGGGRTNGVASMPATPGSGGGNSGGSTGSAGGGLVWIEAADKLRVDGSITANGVSSPQATAGAGSGGGIYLKCQVFAGANNGLIQANGANSANTSAGVGGGGRIAIDYNPASQAAADPVTIRLVALPGAGSTAYSGDIGSVHLPDTQLLKETMDHIQGQLLGFSDWAPDSLTVANRWIRFAEPDFALTVTNDIVIDGSSAVLEMGEARIAEDVFSVALYATLIQYSDTASSLTCGGNMILTNSGALRVYAGATNAVVSDGAVITVGGDMEIDAGSWVYPVSHVFNGGSARFAVGGDLNIAAAAGFSANSHGFAGGAMSRQEGYGYGGGGSRSGGGYGGIGAYTAPGGTYGDAEQPIHPGSGGGRGTATAYSGAGGMGGGLARIAITNTLNLKGQLRANGGNPGLNAGGGSGGGVYVVCRTLTGDGSMRAIGGNGVSTGGAGGGGRIAVWRSYDWSELTYTAATGSGGPEPAAETGTVVRVDLAPYIENLHATNEGVATADLVGYLVGTGRAPATVYCFWGESPGGEDPDQWYAGDDLGVRDIGQVTNSISGLTLGTLYHFRFAASNQYGLVWSTNTLTFSTVGGGSVETLAPGDITAVSATLNADVTSGNPIPDAYILWGDTDPAIDATNAWQRAEFVGTLLGPYAVPVSGLLANKTYFYRGYVVNPYGESFADVTTHVTTLPPELWIEDAPDVWEGDSGLTPMTFTVHIAERSAEPVHVDFATVDGSATAGEDYVFTNGTLTIPAGQTSGQIVVEIIGDTVDEYPYEDLFVTLSSALNATIVGATARGLILDDDYAPKTKTWDGFGNWTNHANWTPYGWPGAGDEVIVHSGAVTLGESWTIGSLRITNSASLVFAGWDTKLTVGGNVLLQTGFMDLPAAFTDAGPSNRVWIACDDFEIASGSAIRADGKGYVDLVTSPYGYGQGAPIGIRAGAGHGGPGGNFSWHNGWPYGSADEPETPGSGGTGSPGGGAVRVDAVGKVTVNGTITASGTVAGIHEGAGAGGSIWITSETIAGSGTLRANGGNAAGTGGGGGGGRIALAYDSAAQAPRAVPPLNLSVRGGTTGASGGAYAGQPGTLWFPDTVLLETTISRINGSLVNLTEWRPPTLTIESLVHFVEPGFNLDVAGDLVVSGSGASLRLGGNEWYRTGTIGGQYGDYIRYTDSDQRPVLNVGGNLVLTNGATLHLHAARTNGTAQRAGLPVAVAGDILIANTSWLYPVAHPFDGAPVQFVCRNLRIDAGGWIDANTRGYAGAVSGQTPYGPGAGPSRNGASYGGLGGPYGTPAPVYGRAHFPDQPGSGGGPGLSTASGGAGGTGGGLVWLDARDLVEVNGLIRANGGAGGASHAGGGSGGAIVLRANRFQGSGTLTANGGTVGGTASGGGGGRIAVWIRVSGETAARLAALNEPPASLYVSPEPHGFNGTWSVNGGAGSVPAYDGEPGTTLWLTPRGGMLQLR